MKIACVVLGVILELILIYFEVVFLSSGLSGVSFIIAAVMGVVISVSAIFIFIANPELHKNPPMLAMFLALWVVSLVSTSYGLNRTSLDSEVAFEGLQKTISEQKLLVEQKQAELDVCKPNVIKLCITPKTTELSALKESLSAMELNAPKYNDYLADKKSKDDLSKDLGVSAKNLTMIGSFLRGLILNLLAYFLFFLGKKKENLN